MKKALAAILLLFLAGCTRTQRPNAAEPASLPFTATPSIQAVTVAPTIFMTATKTATPGLPTSTPRPSPTPRVNLPLKSGKGILLTATQMFDSQNGWGFDSDYHILRTRNGGRTWQDVTPATGYYSRAGFFALNPKTAWATFTIGLYSSPGIAYVWHTVDGGETWTPSQEFRLNVDQYGEPYSSEFYLPQAIQFIDRQTGWLSAIVSYNMNSTRPLLFQTTDGGDTWQTINSRIEFPDACIGVGFVFIDPQTGWVGGNCFAQGVVSNKISFFVLPDGWGIYKTLDGGYSYEQKTFMPMPEEFQQLDLLEKDGNCGEIRLESFTADVIGIEWGCSIFTQLAPDFKYFALSADRGQTWTSWKSTGNEFFLDGRRGWRLLLPGELQQTTNGGLDWVTIKTVTWDNARFDFVDEQEGWAIVSKGLASVFLHTSNGGQTWTELNPVIGP